MSKSIHFFTVLLIATLLVSCAQDAPPSTPPNQVEFNGTTYEFNQVDSVANFVIPLTGDVQVVYGTILSTSSGPYTQLSIVCGTNQFANATAASENIQNYFHTGSQPYFNQFGYNGVAISLHDGVSGLYMTNVGSQSGSSFNFTQISFHSGNPSYVDYTCEFSCLLRNSMDTLDAKPMSGTVSGRFNSEY